MKSFSSTLDLPNLQGYDTGIPSTKKSSNLYRNVFLGIIVFFLFVALLDAFTPQQKETEYDSKLT